MISEKAKIPEVKDFIVKLRELNSDEKLRRLAFYREKRLSIVFLIYPLPLSLIANKERGYFFFLFFIF